MAACSIRIRGVVQGVGFRPFVYRLAHEHRAGGLGAEWRGGRRSSSLKAPTKGLKAFIRAADGRSRRRPPSSAKSKSSQPSRPASRISPSGESERRDQPTVRISPDLPVCDACLRELFDPGEPALSLSLHQLHELWSALHGDLSPALRPAEYDDETVAARCILRRGVSGSWQSALSCAAGRLSAMRAALLAACATIRSSGDDAAIQRAAELLRSWQDRRGQRARRISPGLRCPQRRALSASCASASIARRNRSR